MNPELKEKKEKIEKKSGKNYTEIRNRLSFHFPKNMGNEIRTRIFPIRKKALGQTLHGKVQNM